MFKKIKPKGIQFSYEIMKLTRVGEKLSTLAEDQRAQNCTHTKPFGYVQLCSLSSVNKLFNMSTTSFRLSAHIIYMNI